MIACRSFFRFDRLWTPSGPRFPFQGVLFDHAISAPRMVKAKDGPNSIYQRKKKKLVLATWMPISTQSGTPVAGTSLSLSPRSAVIDSPSEASSTFSSCEVENLSVTHGRIEVSRAQQQVEVIKEHTHDKNSNNDTELANEVEKYSVSVEVGASLIRFIKGKGGSTQKQIEQETGVKIKFPSSKMDNRIVIEGASEESVTRAAEKIARMLEEAVKSPSLDYSHFISLPLAIHPELVDKLQKFQNAILGCNISGHHGNLDSESNEETSDDSDEENKAIAGKLEVENEKEHVRLKIDAVGANSNVSKVTSSVLSDLGIIDKSIFIKPKTFHLTVLMLKLWNKDRVAAATEVLEKISSQANEALDNRPVFVKLEGLACMRGSPAKARVIYAPVEEIGGEGRLLRACQVIIRAYVEAGLVLEKDARQALKLHATLMNASFGKRKTRTRGHSFDARGIFLRHGSEKWGDYLIREAHLSQRFMFDECGYYHCCASIPFPEKQAS